MTTSIATPPKLQFFTAGGVPLSGGKLYSYAAGTTTPLATYTSSTGGTANTNPVILDSRGEANVWFGSGQYKLKLTSSTDVEVWTVDNLNGPDQATLASLAASSGSSLVGYIQSGSGAVATTVQARLRQYVSVIDFGADTSGASSSSAAFTNANNLGNQVLITKGTYLLSTSVTFTVPVNIQYGAVITVPNGVTLTFNREMDAGVYQCFNCTGTGKVVFNSQYTSTGYPEWWGAVTNNGSDCLAAMLACVIACTVTQLQAADYSISSTLKIQTRTRTLRGMGFNYLGNDSASATRVIVLSGSLNCIQMGPDTEPSTIDNFLTDVRVENLQVTRSVNPTIGSDCAGILNQYTLYFTIDKVKAAEHQIGFHYGGTVSGYTTNCRSFRSTTGSGGGADKYYGFYVDGIGYDIGAAGGNASIYFNDCNSSAASTDASFTLPTNSIGFFLQDDFTDCYITNCELNSTAYGIYVSGTGSATQAYGNNDLLITAPVIDVFMVAGIRFDQISKYGSISINGGYCAPAANVTAALIGLTPIAGLYFTDSLGQISISDFQIIGNSSTTCTGITAVTAQNIESRTQIIDCKTTPIALTSVTNSRFLDHISNYGNVTSAAAVQLVSNNSRNYFQVFAVGKTSAFSLGYQGVGTTNTYNELNCTGLDPAAIVSGSANKLVWNSTQITTTGAISSGTTNLAAGVMA